MRKAEFFVPSEAMEEFTNEMVDRGLRNRITGTSEDGEIIIEVDYDRDQSDEVDEIEKILENLCEQLDEQEEEEENEEDNQRGGTSGRKR